MLGYWFTMESFPPGSPMLWRRGPSFSRFFDSSTSDFSSWRSCFFGSLVLLFFCTVFSPASFCAGASPACFCALLSSFRSVMSVLSDLISFAAASCLGGVPRLGGTSLLSLNKISLSNHYWLGRRDRICSRVAVTSSVWECLIRL